MLRLTAVPALAFMLVLAFVALPFSTSIGSRAAARDAEPSTALRAEGRILDRDYFVGAWESRNVEFGRDVEIIWTVRNNSTLDYDFIIDGVPFRGSTGTWDFRDGTLYESWLRPDGSTGNGQAAIERIDDNTFRLTVIDNGAAEYQGLVRIYKRRAPPQTVWLRLRMSL